MIGFPFRGAVDDLLEPSLIPFAALRQPAPQRPLVKKPICGLWPPRPGRRAAVGTE